MVGRTRFGREVDPALLASPPGALSCPPSFKLRLARVRGFEEDWIDHFVVGPGLAVKWIQPCSLRSLGLFRARPRSSFAWLGREVLKRTGLTSLWSVGPGLAVKWIEPCSLRSLGLFRARPRSSFAWLGRSRKSPDRFAVRASSSSAQDWTRTSTPVKALPPQSSVSTNFTTWAGLQLSDCIGEGRQIYKSPTISALWSDPPVVASVRSGWPPPFGHARDRWSPPVR